MASTLPVRPGRRKAGRARHEAAAEREHPRPRRHGLPHRVHVQRHRLPGRDSGAPSTTAAPAVLAAGPAHAGPAVLPDPARRPAHSAGLPVLATGPSALVAGPAIPARELSALLGAARHHGASTPAVRYGPG